MEIVIAVLLLIPVAIGLGMARDASRRRHSATWTGPPHAAYTSDSETACDGRFGSSADGGGWDGGGGGDGGGGC